MTASSPISRSSTIVLKAVILLAGLGVLAFLLWEPNVEGVNANATSFTQIYFDDPFLAFAYLSSIPFFIALYQAFRLVGYAERNELFADKSVKALRMIKYCASAMVPLIVIGVVWLLSGESDDRPPIVAMGTLTSLASVIVAAMANVFERIVQNAVDMKSENDLTV